MRRMISYGGIRHWVSALQMPTLHDLRRIRGQYDQLWGLSREISCAVDIILRSVHALPGAMRQNKLRVARELVAAQSCMLDQLIFLTAFETARDRGFENSDRYMARAVTPTAASERALGTIDGDFLSESYALSECRDIVSASTIDDYDVKIPASPLRSHLRGQRRTYLAVGTVAASQNLSTIRQLNTAASHSRPTTDLSEPRSLANGTSLTTNLTSLIERVASRVPFTRSIIAILCVGAIVGASLTLWLAAPDAQSSGQSGGAAAPLRSEKIEIASQDANAIVLTAAPQQATGDATAEKAQSRLQSGAALFDHRWT